MRMKERERNENEGKGKGKKGKGGRGSCITGKEVLISNTGERIFRSTEEWKSVNLGKEVEGKGVEAVFGG